jgi:hypothetical protein
MAKTDRPTTSGSREPVMKEYAPHAPVPMHHRQKLGIRDAGETNPFGNGNPSKVSTVKNAGPGSKNGW